MGTGTRLHAINVLAVDEAGEMAWMVRETICNNRQGGTSEESIRLDASPDPFLA